MPLTLKFPAFIDPSLVEPYVRDAYIHDLYDGDTVYFHANLGYNHWAAFQTGRLLDTWAQEVRPLASRADGLAAKAHLDELLTRYALNRYDNDSLVIGRRFRIQSVQANNKWFRGIPLDKQGKYGRWLVTIIGADDEGKPVNVNELMVNDGFATRTATD